MSLRALLLALGLVAAGAAAADCPRSQLPQPYFGDLHVHTALSNDAFGMGTRAGPDAAYRYAKGETISVYPGLSLSPSRALDFAAVTDHAEQMAAATICAQPQHPNYDSWACRIERRAPRLGIILGQIAGRWLGGGHCADGACQQAYSSAWQQTVAAAEEHNDPCQFTAFVGYEWSGTGGRGANIHRNVIFNRDPQLPLPFNAFDYPEPTQLWQQLRRHCSDDDSGCDAVTIPHNSNLSLGLMFPAPSDSAPMSAQEREDRARFDRLAEIIQHKGSSECYYTPGGADEDCQFELLPYASFLGKMLPVLATPPRDDSSFLRTALQEGLRHRQRSGSNPFATGFIGSTDSHIATPGQVAEASYSEHHNKSREVAGTVARIPRPAELNPGGLAVLFARENSREALFDAIRRREAYGTSGHRLNVRFFAGGELPAELCQRHDAVALAYEHGVPMGGELHGGGAPRFFLSAMKAPDTPAQPMPGLYKLQIIKGWLDRDGNSHERVFDVAHSSAAPMEASSCTDVQAASASLCTVWEDPHFDPGQDAFYYARVLEQPSCRWNQYHCETVVAQCPQMDSDDPDYQLCCSGQPARVKERAWSSPIWYVPPA